MSDISLVHIFPLSLQLLSSFHTHSFVTTTVNPHTRNSIPCRRHD